jgi:hypothetical protein
MIRLPTPNIPRALLAAALGCILLEGCGPAATAPPASPPPPPVKADVIVTIDGPHHSCVIALYSEAQGSTIPCDDATPFIRDELRVPSGGTYDIRTIPEVDKADMAKLEAGLKSAGYHLVGSPQTGSH